MILAAEQVVISFGPLDPATELASLLRLAAAEYGAEGYQQRRAYLDWLYAANPASRGFADCIVARRDGALVGCMHRMVLPMEGPDGPLRFAVLHNHFIADALRSGPGVLLLRRAVKDLDVGFAPGVQVPLDAVYRRLGFNEYPGAWLVKTLDPLAAGWRLARTRVFGHRRLRIDTARLAARVRAVEVTAQPDDAALGRLCAGMRVDAPATVAWTPALLRWRYFHPAGPRHLLITSGAAMAVIAFGVRRGVAVARLLELVAGEPAFVRALDRVMRAAGAAVALCFAADVATARSLAAAGWRRRDNGTFSFYSGPIAPGLRAGASDVGFEAFDTVFA